MWSRFLWAFGITGLTGLAGCLLLILLADPVGVSPIGIVSKYGYVISDRRFVAPQIVASGDFNSVLGRHLDHSSRRSGLGERGLRWTLRHRRHSRRHPTTN